MLTAIQQFAQEPGEAEAQRSLVIGGYEVARFIGRRRVAVNVHPGAPPEAVRVRELAKHVLLSLRCTLINQDLGSR